MLEGRITVRALPGMVETPLPFDVMDAPQSVALESRLYVEAGTRALSFVAYERAWLGGADFDVRARAYLSEASRAIGAIERVATTDARVTLFASIADGSRRGPEVVDLLRGVALLPDGTVIELRLQTFRAQYTSPPACAALARSLATTLAVGTRTIDRSAGQRVLTSSSGTHTLTVPADWLLAVQEGPDFHRIHGYRFTAFPDRPPELHVSIGDHVGGTATTRGTAGSVLGHAARWSRESQTTPEGPSYERARAHVRVGREEIDALAFSFVPAFLDEAIAIVASGR